MGTIDNALLQKAGAAGCSDSDYNLARTGCCSQWIVKDSELGTLYLDPADLNVALDGLALDACPLCGISSLEVEVLDAWPRDPNPWQWAFHPDADVVRRWQVDGAQ